MLCVLECRELDLEAVDSSFAAGDGPSDGTHAVKGNGVDVGMSITRSQGRWGLFGEWSFR